MSEKTDSTKTKSIKKRSKLDKATMIENSKEKQDELEFEKKKMAEYVNTKKASKELRHLKAIQAKSEIQIAKVMA